MQLNLGKNTSIIVITGSVNTLFILFSASASSITEDLSINILLFYSKEKAVKSFNLIVI